MAERVRIQIEGSDYWANGPNFTMILAHVRALPNARWDKPQRVWIIPGTPDSVQNMLKSAGVTLEPISGPVVSVVPPSKPLPAAVERPRDVIAISCEGQEYWVAGGGFQEMVNAVKNVTGRRWDPQRKVWTVPGPLPDVERVINVAGLRVVTPPQKGDEQAEA